VSVPPALLPTLARTHRVLAVLALCALLFGCQGLAGSRSTAKDAEAAPPADPALAAVSAAPPELLSPGEEVELFDGSTLGMWKPERISIDDAVRVEQGALQLSWGSPGTSVAWTGARLPPNYELSLEVMRIEGSGSGYWFLTFPIDESRSCTLTLASQLGWLCSTSGPVGDGVFTRSVGLEGGAWHTVRLRVIRGRVEAFLDAEELVVEPASTPPTELADVPSSASLEMATWSMTAAVRDIRLKRLPDSAR
jgi:hypothetical protein